MKKLLSIILAGTMLFSFAACGEETEEKEKAKNNADIVEDGGVDISDDTQVGDYINFGSYEQDNDTSNGTEPIEWLVLDKKDGKILVVSKYGLDCQDFHNDMRSEVTWETCDLRSWLNDEFINEAFTDFELVRVPTVTVTADADPNPETDVDMGNDTQDKVFVLSVVEMNKYFDSESERACEITRYAELKDVSYWWLRTLCYNDSAYCVEISDGGLTSGAPHCAGNVAVRPALWIEL
ncbi:MAG: hypothetical protein IKM25_05895 [Clostridia bacterium]|nr:hypothetical protein [Clostridia bacterium]